MSLENGVHHRSRRAASSRSSDRVRTVNRNNQTSGRRPSSKTSAGATGSKRVSQSSAGGSYNRSYQSGGPRRKNSRKKNGGGNIPLIAGGIVALIAVIAIVVFLIKGGSLGGSDPTEMIETQAEGSFKNDVYVDLGVITDEIPEEESAAEGGETETDEESEETSGAPQGAVINLKGLTPEQAKERIASLYDWSMVITNADADEGATVTPTLNAEEITTAAATMPDAENPDSLPEGETAAETTPSEIVVTGSIEVPDLVAVKTEELISEIAANEELYTAATETASEETEDTEESGESESETAPAAVYTLSLDGLDDRIDRIVSDAEMMWNKAARGGSIGSYDAETDTFKMEGARDGFELDTEKLRSDIVSAVGNKDFSANIAVTGTVISGSDDTSLPDYKIIGTYTTETTSNSVRNKNIQLACQALNGTIVRPGEEFSFNDTVGERTEAKGYGAAAAYNNGEVVQEVGGGVCQVSTTLYNAVLRSGLKTTKRQSHTFKPTYVTPGFDATISWGGPDYMFINAPAIEEYSNSDSYSIGIKASYSNRKVTVSIYGRPVLKDGITYELKSEKVKDIPVVRKPIPEGSDKTPTTGTEGSQWTTNLVVKKDGEVVRDSLDHNTYYSGHIEYYDENAETSSETLPSSSVDPSAESGMAETAETPAELSTEPSYAEGPQGGPGVTIPSTEGPGSVETTQSPGPGAVQPTEGPSTGGPGSGPQTGGGGVISDAPISPIG